MLQTHDVNMHGGVRAPLLPAPRAVQATTLLMSYQWLHAAFCALALAGTAVSLGGVSAVQANCAAWGGAPPGKTIVYNLNLRLAVSERATGTCCSRAPRPVKCLT